jgi:hypothetical protein
MDFETWTKFLGKTQDDADLKTALAAAGVKKIPKLDPDETFVQIELKGQGLELVLTDEAILKELDDQDLGEGPLIVSGVVAKLDKAQGRDLYKGALPHGITAAMSQSELRKLLGKPGESDIDADVWMQGAWELGVSYTKGGASLYGMSMTLPNAY